MMIGFHGGFSISTRVLHYLGKLTQLAVFLVGLSIIVFILSRLSPGDPLMAYYGDALEHMTPAQKDAAMARLALDQSWLQQYLVWAKNFLSGDLGISFIFKQPVGDVISNLWVNTLLLGGIAFILTFACATGLAVFCARREGSVIDTIVCKIGTVTSLIPTFFVALLCILIFAVNLRILPTSGAYSIGGKYEVWDRVLHLILPVFVLVISHLWYYAYIMRNKLIEELHKDYVLLLRVKKLSDTAILYRHCLRNSLPTLITLMSISLAHIIAGTYIVELVFSYPGLGSLAFESARYKDYNALSAITLITGFVVILAGIIGQEIAAHLDPTMRHDSVGRPQLKIVESL